MYVLDTNTVISLGHYYPKQFPSFWSKMDSAVASGLVTSVREVKNELARGNDKPHLEAWVQASGHVFCVPAPEELAFVAEMFASVPRFQDLIRKKQRLSGLPVADPFLVAAGHVRDAVVVTEEYDKPNAVCIPSVCRHYGVACIRFEELMAREGWTF